MREKGIFEVKAKLSQICAEVAASGEPVTVSRRGVPLVRIVPIPKKRCRRESVWDSVEESRSRYGPMNEEIEVEKSETEADWDKGAFDDE